MIWWSVRPHNAPPRFTLPRAPSLSSQSAKDGAAMGMSMRRVDQADHTLPVRTHPQVVSAGPHGKSKEATTTIYAESTANISGATSHYPRQKRQTGSIVKFKV